MDVNKECVEKYSIQAKEKDIIKDVTPKDVYNSWQTSVMKRLPDFAYITNMVVDRRTSKFLSNQNGVMKSQMLSMIKKELFDSPGTSIFCFYISYNYKRQIRKFIRIEIYVSLYLSCRA